MNGGLVYGFSHPELGHLRVTRPPGDGWPGACAVHGDCVEGLASGTAIAARAGTPAKCVPTDSPLWEPVAHALAQLLHTIVLATAPRRIAGFIEEYIVAPGLGSFSGPLGALALATDAYRSAATAVSCC